MTVPSDPSSPRHVRLWVQAQLEHASADARVVEDLRLVASELCANAVEHVGTASIEVRLGVTDPDWWVLAVTTRNCDSTPPDPSQWMLAAPMAPSGRGLGIVRELSDRIDVETSHDSVTISCWRRRDRIPGP